MSLIHQNLFNKSIMGFPALMLHKCKLFHQGIEFDFDYLCNENNRLEIKRNIFSRKNVGDIDKLQKMWKDFHNCTDDLKKEELKEQLHKEAFMIPNKSSPHLLSYGKKPKVLKLVNEKPRFDYKPYSFLKIAQKLQCIKGPGDTLLPLFAGSHCYYLTGGLADLEQALIK